MIRPAVFFIILSLTACATPRSPSPQDAFFDRLTSLCGHAFAGRLVSSDAVDADMAGKPMVMHVRSCAASEIHVPFHVGTADGGWDRSRTWVISRTANGLRLKHDHRHEDGSADAVTMYGGDSAGVGTAARQDFLVDAESIASFRANNLPRSVTNIWSVEVEPGSSFAYQLSRTGQNARFFRVEFDLSRMIDPPAAPWGHQP